MPTDDPTIDASPGENALTAVPFPLTIGRVKGYERGAVDAFLEAARISFEADPAEAQLNAADVRHVAFPLVRHGYVIAAVDAALSRIEDAFAGRERSRAVSSRGARAWVGRTRETGQVILDRLSRPPRHRFDRVDFFRYGYRVDEVDLIADKLARYLESGDPVTVEQVRSIAFRMQRGGYREVQVDAVLDAVVEVMLAVV